MLRWLTITTYIVALIQHCATCWLLDGVNNTIDLVWISTVRSNQSNLVFWKRLDSYLALFAGAVLHAPFYLHKCRVMDTYWHCITCGIALYHMWDCDTCGMWFSGFMYVWIKMFGSISESSQKRIRITVFGIMELVRENRRFDTHAHKFVRSVSIPTYGCLNPRNIPEI